MFFIIEKGKETVLDFSKGSVKLWFYFILIKYYYKMSKYNPLNVKLSNSQLNKLKFGIKNGAEVILNLSSNLNLNSNDEANFPNKLLLTNTQVSKIRKAFTNGSLANIKFSKTQLSKVKSGEFNVLNLINPAEVLCKMAKKTKDLSNKVWLDDVIKIADVSRKFLPDPKNILAGCTIFGTGITLTNNEIKDIIKVIKSLENRGMLLKRITRKITSQEGGFLNFLRPLRTTGLPLIKNVLTPFAKMECQQQMQLLKKNSQISNCSINNFKWRNWRHN